MKTNKKENKTMKSKIPLLVIPVLAALVLAGCAKNTPSETMSPPSSMGSASGTMGATSDKPATPMATTGMAAAPSMSNTEMPATNSMSSMGMSTNTSQ